MGAPLSLLICSIGVLGLFFLDRDNSVRNSNALWLPVIWLWIAGSRPVSSWFGGGGGGFSCRCAALLFAGEAGCIYEDGGVDLAFQDRDG